MITNKPKTRKFEEPQKDGAKYLLLTTWKQRLPYAPTYLRLARFVIWYAWGIIICEGFRWNGTSGPSIDTDTNEKAALAHDALYDLLKEHVCGPPGSKEWKYHRKLADKIFLWLLRKDGMFFLRAYYHYLAVRLFGAKAAGK